MNESINRTCPQRKGVGFMKSFQCLLFFFSFLCLYLRMLYLFLCLPCYCSDCIFVQGEAMTSWHSHHTHLVFVGSYHSLVTA